MAYLLDTNVCIEYLRNPNARVRQQLMSKPNSDVFTCSVVVGELYYGVHRSDDIPKNLKLVEELLQAIGSIDYGNDAAVIFGQLRAELASKGNVIGPYDLQIASIALLHGFVLVTHNTREFTRVPNLLVEDWH